MFDFRARTAGRYFAIIWAAPFLSQFTESGSFNPVSSMSNPSQTPEDDTAAAMRLAGRQWLQMLARAGVSQLGSGDVESDMGQYFSSILVTDSSAKDAPTAPPGAAAALSASGSDVGGASEDSANTMGVQEAEAGAEADSGVRKTGPSRRVVTGTGINPALKRSGEAVDDGPDIETFPDLPDADRGTQLQLLDDQVKACTRCPQLAEYRTQTVFGVGNIRPRLVMMGEAPGADEDRLGEPMVGVAGQLLDKIIAAMKLRREEVYILNTVKCRPPQNRNPTEEECAHCREFWRQQLEILKPECIVCLGAVASKTLLQTSSPVGRLRGRFHDYRGVPVAVTYHPAYLLRTESAKRQTWEDMKMVMERLGITL